MTTHYLAITLEVRVDAPEAEASIFGLIGVPEKLAENESTWVKIYLRHFVPTVAFWDSGVYYDFTGTGLEFGFNRVDEFCDALLRFADDSEDREQAEEIRQELHSIVRSLGEDVVATFGIETP